MLRTELLEPRTLLAGVGPTVFVDLNDPTPDGTGCGSDTNPCNTIQKGVDVAPADGVVRVAKGTYTESVVISKNLTLTGAGAIFGSSGRDVIVQSPDFTRNSIQITDAADCVTIDSLDVTLGSAGIFADGVETLTLRNVGAYLNSLGVGVINGGQLSVEGGLYEFNSQQGIAAVHLSGDVTFKSLLLDNVRVRKNNEHGILMEGVQNVGLSNVSVDENNTEGVHLVRAGNVTVTDTSIRGNTSFGFLIEDALDVGLAGVTISENKHTGLSISKAGELVLTDAIINKNEFQGVLVDTAASFSDKNGIYRGNHRDGVRLVEIAGAVALDTSTFEGNDGDRNGVGDGFPSYLLTLVSRHNRD